MSTDYCITPTKRSEILQFNIVKLSSAMFVLYMVNIQPQEKGGGIFKKKHPIIMFIYHVKVF